MKIPDEFQSPEQIQRLKKKRQADVLAAALGIVVSAIFYLNWPVTQAEPEPRYEPEPELAAETEEPSARLSFSVRDDGDVDAIVTNGPVPLRQLTVYCEQVLDGTTQARRKRSLFGHDFAEGRVPSGHREHIAIPLKRPIRGSVTECKLGWRD